MPTLLEVQQAMRASLVARDDAAAASMLDATVSADRLNIYRNTFVAGLTRTLRLAYPAVDRLVGEEFFDGAAGFFIAQHPPRMAWLDQYGAEFPEFLLNFAPAASLAYLPGVARLEWAVNRALHAEDSEPLDLSRLGELALADQGRISFVPHPSVALIRSEHPVDSLWRAVLDRDDTALRALEMEGGSVHLLVERRESGVEVSRMAEPEWRFAADLCAGRPLEEACAAARNVDTSVRLAGHLALGRFIDFTLTEPESWRDPAKPAATQPESSA